MKKLDGERGPVPIFTETPTDITTKMDIAGLPHPHHLVVRSEPGDILWCKIVVGEIQGH